MRVLLVDVRPSKEGFLTMIPLAFRKLYTYYKSEGDDVEYIEAGQIPKHTPDLICFSTVFLFNLKNELGFIRTYASKYPEARIRVGGISASLRPEIFQSKLEGRADIHVGVCEEFEHHAPDYNFVPSKFSYGFTSRGCINKCPWCVVPTIEGNIYPISGWQNQLGPHETFVAMDNNLTACGADHIESVLMEMEKRKMKIDFNQGLDCILFLKDKRLQEVIYKYKKNIHTLRFAWDSKRQDKHILKVLEILKENKQPATWHVLYAFKDDINEIHNRLSTLVEHDQEFKLMRYRDIETGAYIEDEDPWYKYLRKYINRFNVTGVMNGAGTGTKALFPKDFDDFKRMMKAFNAYVDGFIEKNKTTNKSAVGYVVKSHDIERIVQMAKMIKEGELNESQ